MGWWWTSRRWWVKDDQQFFRYFGGEERRRHRFIKRRGLPVTIQFHEDEGGFCSLRFTPRRRFRHLSAPRSVKSAYRRGYYYHLTVAHRREIDKELLHFQRHTLAALRFVKQGFARPVEAVLWVQEINERNVVVLARETPALRQYADNLVYLRTYVGDHGQELTVSM